MCPHGLAALLLSVLAEKQEHNSFAFKSRKCPPFQIACAVSLHRYLSTRGFVWTDVDKARSGGLPFVFEPGMSFERYVDYAMDVPMYFVYR